MSDARKPWHEIRNFWTLLPCIRQILTALLFMFSTGYVHRDTSTGNILVAYADGKVVCKLSDLEYAKMSTPAQPSLQMPKQYTIVYGGRSRKPSLPIYATSSRNSTS
uniref:Protein kinase domain-containing protein n=1 Tax=Moniliophthora roreri TaxID=221103 RepID=A0A0W0FAC5_MONRR